MGIGNTVSDDYKQVSATVQSWKTSGSVWAKQEYVKLRADMMHVGQKYWWVFALAVPIAAVVGYLLGAA